MKNIFYDATQIYLSNFVFSFYQFAGIKITTDHHYGGDYKSYYKS